MNAIIIFTLALAAVVAGQAQPGWNPNQPPHPGQAKQIDPMMLAVMMMGDGKMSSILPFLLMSQPGGQNNMMPIMMMMMGDEDQKLGDILPLLLMMQPGQDQNSMMPLMMMMMMQKDKKEH